MHVKLSSGARSDISLFPYFEYVRREGSKDTQWMPSSSQPSLLTNDVSTKISFAGPFADQIKTTTCFSFFD